MNKFEYSFFFYLAILLFPTMTAAAESVGFVPTASSVYEGKQAVTMPNGTAYPGYVHRDYTLPDACTIYWIKGSSKSDTNVNQRIIYWQQGDPLYVVPADGIAITAVRLKCLNATYSAAHIDCSEGTMTDTSDEPYIKEWSGSSTTELIFETASQMRLQYIEISYEAADTSIDAIDSDNAPTELFDLRGLPVDPSAATPGLYIRRSGSRTTKILIRP